VGPNQGTSVALSGDGNTAIVGLPGDNNQTGAAWVYTRSNGVWGQQGSKLVGTQSAPPNKAGPSRCPGTATPPSWAPVDRVAERIPIVSTAIYAALGDLPTLDGRQEALKLVRRIAKKAQ
jgi:hypothetical protein